MRHLLDRLLPPAGFLLLRRGQSFSENGGRHHDRLYGAFDWFRGACRERIWLKSVSDQELGQCLGDLQIVVLTGTFCHVFGLLTIVAALLDDGCSLWMQEMGQRVAKTALDGYCTALGLILIFRWPNVSNPLAN